MQQPHLARAVIEYSCVNQHVVIVATAVTSTGSVHFNIMPTSVQRLRDADMETLRISSSKLHSSVFPDYQDALSRQWRCHLPTQTWKTASAVSCIPGSFWLCHNTLPWGVYVFLQKLSETTSSFSLLCHTKATEGTLPSPPPAAHAKLRAT